MKVARITHITVYIMLFISAILKKYQHMGSEQHEQIMTEC